MGEQFKHSLKSLKGTKKIWLENTPVANIIKAMGTHSKTRLQVLQKLAKEPNSLKTDFILAFLCEKLAQESWNL